MKVWDRLVRALHWMLVASVAVAWSTGEGALVWHEVAGYAGLAVIAVRIGWGFAGPHYARFGQFVRGPRTVWRYAVDVAGHRERRYIGHNPLGGWMVCGLLGCVAATAFTGWMYTLDAFWGLAWLEWLHRALAWALVGLIAVHVGGVAFTSVRQRENLVVAMMTGRKPPPGHGDVAR